MSDKCPHGRVPTPWAGGPNTEPILTCTCCGSHFVQIPSGWFSPTETVSRRWNPPVNYRELTGLCGDCGGQYVTERETRPAPSDEGGSVVVNVDAGDYSFTWPGSER